MTEEPTSITKAARPIGQSIIEILRMPIEIVDEAVPELQKQIQELPDIIRANADFAKKSFSEIPQQFRQGMTREAGNAPLTVTRALSPFPILSPEELAEEARKQAERFGNNAQNRTASLAEMSKSVAEQFKQATAINPAVPKEVEEQTKKIAEKIFNR